MGRALAILFLAAAAAADDALLERWDKPRRESFEMNMAWPERVVEVLMERYGRRVELDPVDLERADFVARDVTFFEALDRFAALHRLQLVGAPARAAGAEEDPEPLRLTREDNAARPTPVAHVGPTRLSVQSVSFIAVRRLSPAKGEDVPLAFHEEPEVGKLRVRLRWLAEPGLEAAALAGLKAHAEDDLGKRLRMLPAFADEPITPNTDFLLEFAPPSPGAKSIRKLEGTARVLLPLERGKVEFLATEVGQTKPLGAARLTLDGIEEKAVAFRIKGKPCSGMKAGRLDPRVGPWDENPRVLAIRAYDADGRELMQGGGMQWSSGFFGRSEVKVWLEATPVRVIFEALVRGAERDVAFSFADVPLRE